jgi:hypothetical protein
MKHKNIVELYSVHEVDDYVILKMECVQGYLLIDLIEEQIPFGQKFGLRIIR